MDSTNNILANICIFNWCYTFLIIISRTSVGKIKMLEFDQIIGVSERNAFKCIAGHLVDNWS